MTDFPYISGDSHLEIHPQHWIGRVSERYRDRAPRVTRLEDGTDALLIEDAPPRRLPAADFYGGKGRDSENWGSAGASFGNTPGTGTAEQRIREQDADRIAAEVLFPGQQTGPRLWRLIEEDPVYLAIVQAWNSWLAEDYCAVNPDRLIGLGVIPWTNAQDATAELERCAELGLKGVALGTFPNARGYPTPEDDQFWSKAVELRMPVTVHVEFDRQGPRAGPLFQYPSGHKAIHTRGIVDMLANQKFASLGAVNAVQLMFARVFDRFPDLKIFFAETQIGWIPHFLEQADEMYEWLWQTAERDHGIPPLARAPSEYIRDHCYWGFQYNPVGVRMRDEVGVNRLVWATDFPHQGSEWPETHDRIIPRNFTGIPEDDVYRMVCGNACEFFRLDAEIYRD